MSFINRHKGKITALILVIILLMASYFFGGESPSENVVPESKSEVVTEVEKEEKLPPAKEEAIAVPKTEETEEKAAEEKAENAEVVPNEKDTKTALVNQEPQNPQEEISDKELTCTLSIVCSTLLTNKERLDAEKSSLVPADGVIFPEKEVVFYEGESVFNILMREMKKAKIHMEYTSAPIYNSAYIEGIGNLYEFDCGELSGWMYKVNGWFPNYGCSRYQLKAGDKVEWVYTCDLGKDVGGEYSARNGYENE